jgi:hypothetical protein
MPESSASRFLTALWSRRPPGLIQLWELSTRRSTYVLAPVQADAFADRPDAFAGVSLAERDHGRYRRCRNDQAAAIAGLWADIDVNGGPDHKQGAAPDIAQAAALAAELLEPTILVSSGYGLQAWWCLERPWAFADRGEQLAAATMAAQWQHLLRLKAQMWDFTIDATHDLARILRLPGTINAKGGGEVPVELLACAPERRYSQAELRARCSVAGDIQVSLSEPTRGQLPTVDVGARAGLDPSIIEALIENSPEFRQSWTHGRSGAWSLSEYDLSIATIAAQAGLTDQQLGDLIALHRRTYDPADVKGERADYLRRTVAKARQPSTPIRQEVAA